MTVTIHFIEANKSVCRNPGLGVAINNRPVDVLPLAAVTARGKTPEDVKEAYKLANLANPAKTGATLAQNARWILGL